ERGEPLLADAIHHADDDDRNGPTRHLRLHEGHAIHARHVEVAGDDVGFQLFGDLERLAAIARGGHHFEEWTPGEHLGDDLPDVGGVVDDEDSGDTGHDLT